MKKESGITLVTLVVTIIVMLILAAVGINLALDDHGVIKQSGDAADKWEGAENKEISQLDKLSNYLNEYLQGDYGTGDGDNNGGDNNNPGGGETLQGVVTFGEVTWSNQKASVIVNTTASYNIEYQKNGGSWNTITKGQAITDLLHGDIINARVTDGNNHGNSSQKQIQDTIKPVVNINIGSKTTSTIPVSVSATDNESGMIASPTYIYYIKQSNEPDSSYVQKQSNTSSSYTFDNLTQGVSYDIKVEVSKDNANNVGASTATNIITNNIPGGEDAIEQGAITFGATTWSSGSASITISTNTSYQIEYQKNSTTGSWTTIASGSQVTGLKHGDVVNARLKEGNNYGNYANVNIVDGINPQLATISLSSTNVNVGDNLTATITHIDNESGIDITKCKWILNTTSGNIGTDLSRYTNTFTSNEQTISLPTNNAGTYYLHVLSVDNAGRKKETISSETMIETINQYPTSIAVSPISAYITIGQEQQLIATVSPSNAVDKTIKWLSSNTSIATVDSNGLVKAQGVGNCTIYARSNINQDVYGSCTINVEKANANEVFEEGDYVYYNDKNNIPHKCIVLYDRTSSFGLQIVTQETIGTIEVGGASLSQAISSYNNIVKKLNDNAMTYNNTTYSAQARAVCSVPSNSYYESSQYVNLKFESTYSGKLKNYDFNAQTDYDQMTKLEILNTLQPYLVPSRAVFNSTYSAQFSVGYIAQGEIKSFGVIYLYSNKDPVVYKDSAGIRPVFTLRPTVKAISGDGTPGNPYILGI